MPFSMIPPPDIYERSVLWGLISGALSNQTDLQDVLNAKDSILTFASGLTRSTNAVSNDLITGKAGGQTILGDTLSGGSLTLSSTAHAVKGKIILGQNSCYDQANDRLYIGATNLYHRLSVKQSSNDVMGGFALVNASDASTFAMFNAYTILYLGYAPAASGGDQTADFNFNTMFKSDGTLLLGTGGADGSCSLTFGGNSAKTIGLNRHTTAGQAGQNLTIQAGAPKAGETDKAGGTLFIKGGISTGNVDSGVEIQGCVAGATGTQDNSCSTQFKVLGNKLGFYGAVPVIKDTGWSVSNVVTTKTYDVNTVTLSILANVVGTLINQVKSLGLVG